MKFFLPDSSIRRIANGLGYTPDPECAYLGDGGICLEALKGEFEVLVRRNLTPEEPWDIEKRTIKPRDVCPFAGEPPDPEERYCKYYEHSIGINNA